jgi:hypothetical protein
MQGITNATIKTITTNASFDTDAVDMEQTQNFSIQASYDNTTPAAFTFATTDVKPVYLTLNSHGLFTGNVVRATTSGGLPAPLALLTDYYVIRLGANTFQLATSAANAHAAQPLTITSQGTGNHTLTVTTPTAVAVAHTAITVAAKTVTKTAHGLATGMKVQVTSDDTLPTGYTALTDFFVVRTDADTFQLSDTEAHAIAGTNIVDPVNQGAGTHTFTVTAQADAVLAYTAVTVGDTTITETTHGMLLGLVGRFTTSTTLPTGLSGGTDYWVIPVTANTFRVASSLVNAQAGTFVDISTVGTGTHTFTATTLAISIQPQVSNDPDSVGWVAYGSPTTATATGDTMYDIPTDYKWARLSVTVTTGQLTFKAVAAGQG